MKDYSFSLTYENETTVPGYQITYNSTLGFNYLNLTLNGSSLGNIRIDFETSESLPPIYFDFTNHSSYPKVHKIEVTTSSNNELSIPSWASSDLKVMNEAIEVTVNHSESPSVFAKLIISRHTEKTLGVLVPPVDSIITYTSSYTNESIFLDLSTTRKSIKWELPDDFPIGYYSYEIQVRWNASFGYPPILHSERGLLFVPDPEPILMTSESTVGGITIDEHQEMLNVPIWEPNQEIEMVLHVSDDTGMQDGEIHVQLLHYYLFAADRSVLSQQILAQSSYSDNVYIDWFKVPDEPIPLPDEEEYEMEIYFEIFVLLFFIRDTVGNYIIDSVFFTIYDQISFDSSFLLVIGAVVIGVIGVIIFFVRRNSRNRIDPYSYRYSVSHPQAPASLETTPARTKFCIFCGQKIPHLASFCSHCGKNVDFNQ